MIGRLLAAGWPFAGLLALDAASEEAPDAASDSIPLQGLIIQNDEAGIVVLESGDTETALAIGPTTRYYGVDGYPIARGDIHAGDTVEAVQHKTGDEWATIKVRVMGRAPCASFGRY
jgi:hypothetical protein